MAAVRSDRLYRFTAPPDAVWEAIAAVDRYRSWWPWLRGFEADGLIAGDEWRCLVQPPLPYSLRFSIHLEEVDEQCRIAASVDGDIVGIATVDVMGNDGGGSEVRLVSELSPQSGFLRGVARFARPVVRFGHDWVLDTGARQFRSRAL